MTDSVLPHALTQNDLLAWRKKPILVTGGTGFLGRRVIALGNRSQLLIHNLSASRQPASDVIHHQVDLREPEKVTQAVKEIQPAAILHLAAGGVAYGSGDMASLFQINVMGLQAIFEAALTLNPPPPVITAGSWFEYAPVDEPLTEDHPTHANLPYTTSKLAAHALASYYAQHMPVTVLRLFSLYGIGEASPRLVPYIIEASQQGQPIDLTPGEQIRDYVYVDDAATGFWQALINPAEIGKLRVLNLGTGTGVSLKTLIHTLADVLREHDIEPNLKFGARPYRDGEIMHAVADVNQLKSALGWIPSTSLVDGLRIMVSHHLSR